MKVATLVSVQVGRPQTMQREDGTAWTSGIVKASVEGNVFVGAINLDGDAQADLKNHGGPDKAVLGYSREHYALWQAELGVSLVHGAFGENLTWSDWTEDTVCLGDVHAVGDVLLEVSQPRQPCWKLNQRWKIPDLEARVRLEGRTGWYYRVLREGHIRAGLTAQVVDRPYPEWTVREASRVMESKDAAPEWATLANLPVLAQSWRAVFQERIAKIQSDGTLRP